MDKTAKMRSEFIEAGDDAPKVFEFVEKTLDEMPFTVQPAVILALDFGALVERDDGRCAARENEVNKGLRSVASISNDVLRVESVNERSRLRYCRDVAQP